MNVNLCEYAQSFRFTLNLHTNAELLLLIIESAAISPFCFRYPD